MPSRLSLLPGALDCPLSLHFRMHEFNHEHPHPPNRRKLVRFLAITETKSLEGADGSEPDLAELCADEKKR